MNDELATIFEDANQFGQVAAQPIFDIAKKRVAIELRQRSVSTVRALQLDSAATSELTSVCEKLGEFIAPFRCELLLQVSAAVLLQHETLPLSANSIILLLSNITTPDAVLIAAVKRYKKRGFRIALNDSELNDNWQLLIAQADIIRIDVRLCQLDDVQRHKDLYGRSGLVWLADNVETEQQLSTYAALGFSWFQGYFLHNKLMVAQKKIEPAAIKLAEIISCLFVVEPDINKLATLLQDEPAIVVALLKLANSPLYRKTRPVSSVKEMVLRLGLELTRKWVLTYAVLGSCTQAAAITVLSRAFAAQSIAERWQVEPRQSQQYFLAAIISGADILFGIDSRDFLPHLSIEPAIKKALKHNSGPMAEALNIIRRIEHGFALLRNSDVAELPYLQCYTAALAQVQQRLAESGG
ncbi:MAG TPA: HDOD domain-containing protein [Rheinheimera sp.]|nr:HDOD domain-containing protein [Rheinheimera sp.]